MSISPIYSGRVTNVLLFQLRELNQSSDKNKCCLIVLLLIE